MGAEHVKRVCCATSFRSVVSLAAVGHECGICAKFTPLAQVAAADSGAPTNSTTTKTTTSTTTTTTSTTTWGGLSWGIGLAADFDLGGTRVNGASVVNNMCV
jgi:hypothetical protein